MNQIELISDIRATFPMLDVMRREMRADELKVWMVGAQQHAEMPDGLSFFCDCAGCRESGSHDNGVHGAFVGWLEKRGFYLERYDEFWWVPTRLPTEEELAEWDRIQMEHHVVHSMMPDGGCPF